MSTSPPGRNRTWACTPLNVNAYEPLVVLEPDYSMSPGLAQRWEQVGPNTFRFHLRPGVTFHDGSPFGAADVKYTFDRIASGGGGLVGLGTDSTVVGNCSGPPPQSLLKSH